MCTLTSIKINRNVEFMSPLWGIILVLLKKGSIVRIKSEVTRYMEHLNAYIPSPTRRALFLFHQHDVFSHV